MNRRDFFKLASVAPLALPIAIKAAASSEFYASGEVIGQAFIGMQGESIYPLRSSVVTLDASPLNKVLTERFAEMQAFSIPSHRLFTPAEQYLEENSPRHVDCGVEAQMIEHDLFNLEIAA